MAKKTRSQQSASFQPTTPAKPQASLELAAPSAPQGSGFSLGSLGAGFLGGVAASLLVTFLVNPAPKERPHKETKPASPAPVAAVPAPPTPAPASAPQGHIRPNVATDFNPTVDTPHLGDADYVDELASVIGDVQFGKDVFLAPFSSVRGDEGTPIFLDDDTNVQDGVVIHALETEENGVPLPQNQYVVNGKPYAVFVGKRVSLAHQSQVHGPAWVEDDVFVGMQSIVFKAHIGKGSVIEPTAIVIGVTVPPGRYVPSGMVLKKQEDADALPVIDEKYPFKDIDRKVVHVNSSLAQGYLHPGSAPAHHEPESQNAPSSQPKEPNAP